MFNNVSTPITINNIPYSSSSYTTYEYSIIGTGEIQIQFMLNSNNFMAIDDVSITIDAGTTINIDEANNNNSTIEANNGKIVNVATSRTLTGNIWNTLCLPYNVTKATMVQALGEDQDIQMRTYSSYADGVMNFTSVEDNTTITAGTPFLLKLNTTVENPTFSSVTVSNTAAQTVTHDNVSFVGTYSSTPLATDGTNLFITTDGTLAIPTTDGNTMNGMRAYISVPESMKFTANEVRLATNDEATAVQSVAMVSQQQQEKPSIYALTGQRRQHLQKGLNIINGKLTLNR